MTAVPGAWVETSRVKLVRCARWKDSAYRCVMDIAPSLIISSQTPTEEASRDHGLPAFTEDVRRIGIVSDNRQSAIFCSRRKMTIYSSSALNLIM